MPIRLGTDMPTLDGATQWLNASDIPTIQDGRTTLIHFWAVSCHICHETMSTLLDIRDKYLPRGLQVIAVHLPRIEEDADVVKVNADIARYGITQPVGLDHERAIADRFQNEYVPAFFVFDRDGKLTFRAAGDKGFLKLESKIREALGITD